MRMPRMTFRVKSFTFDGFDGPDSSANITDYILPASTKHSFPCLDHIFFLNFLLFIVSQIIRSNLIWGSIETGK
jgi:hypothetical protein